MQNKSDGETIQNGESYIPTTKDLRESHLEEWVEGLLKKPSHYCLVR